MSSAQAPEPADPHRWLEDVTGERALAWVREHNARTEKALAGTAEFTAIQPRLRAILDSQARIPTISKHGDFYYNFWRDAAHPKGIWRRTTLAEYRKAEPAWDTVLDLDALAKREGVSWVWKSATWLRPGYDRVLLGLSRGGGDAVVVREFDVPTRTFVADGFSLPEAKGSLGWRDRDTVYVQTDFGAGSLTASGYPRIVKEWRRGTPLSAARVVFEGKPEDVSVGAWVSDRFGFRREFVTRSLTFFTSETYLRTGDTFTRLDLPTDTRVGTWRDFITVTLRKDWTVGGRTYPAGAFLVMPWDRFLAGERSFDLLYTPGPRKSLAGVATFAHHLVVNELDNVRSRLYQVTRTGDTWQRTPLPAPEFGQLSLGGVDEETDDYFLTVTDFLTPTSLYYGALGRSDRELLKQLPAFFQTDGLEVTQREAISADGTRIPYFQVARRGLALDGTAPTLLNGYGGFQVSETPTYSAGRGVAWLERGGVFVLANIRGGGEFGPAWHQAALKANRPRAFEDFAAVARDLIARKVTSPRHLGIIGGSNGGLLMGAMYTQYPELFGAIVCQVPLLDMRRYHRLLAGASWMGEYGNPDLPDEWAFISRYSPYHQVKPDAKYPPILFTSSTRDDRVHPGHARKMAALLESQQHPFLLYENVEGGHAGAADNQQQAFMNALAYAFLWQQLR